MDEGCIHTAAARREEDEDDLSDRVMAYMVRGEVDKMWMIVKKRDLSVKID